MGLHTSGPSYFSYTYDPSSSSLYRDQNGNEAPFSLVSSSLYNSGSLIGVDNSNRFLDYLSSGFSIYTYDLYGRDNLIASIGDPGLLSIAGGGYGAINKTVSVFPIVVSGESAAGGEGWTEGAGHFNDGIGGFGSGMGKLSGTFRLTDGSYNGSNLSVKYYSSGWNGGSRAGISTYSAAEWGSRIGKGSIIASVGLGAYSIYSGYQQDGGTYGLNAQVATGQTIGSIGGGMAGAEIGAAIGVWFGGFGAIPGAIIGGVIGGWAGSEAGGATVLQIRK